MGARGAPRSAPHLDQVLKDVLGVAHHGAQAVDVPAQHGEAVRHGRLPRQERGQHAHTDHLRDEERRQRQR